MRMLGFVLPRRMEPRHPPRPVLRHHVHGRIPEPLFHLLGQLLVARAVDHLTADVVPDRACSVRAVGIHDLRSVLQDQEQTQPVSDPALRQRSHAGLNKGEASNALRRAVFFHRQGEIRDRTFEKQSFRASGLSLIAAAIVHWNTVYLDRAVRQLRAQGAMVPDDLLAHVAPLGWEHIGLTGDYVWTDPNPIAPFRPLREVRSMFQPLAA